MQKHQLLALAAFITSLANDAESAPATDYSTVTDPPTPVKTRKPRQTATPEPEKTEEPPAPTKTYEDMQKLIEPWVKGARGAEIKAILHSKFNGIAVKAMDPKDYAAFEVEVLKLSPVVPPIATDASDY